MIMTVNIRFQLQIAAMFIIIFNSTHDYVVAQDTVLNKHGLWIINNTKLFNATTKSNPNKQMVDIQKFIPDVILDLRYATANNFMHKKLYPSITNTYLRLPAAQALQRVDSELKEMGFGLKIFDAYRPYSVTEKMWEPIKDDRYVADPKKGSGHNRGIAVDLTIINLKTNKELPMGTGYDNFTDTAHQNFIALPKEILVNRNILKSLMEKHGFVALESEWWHYFLPNASDFELLDIPFKKLKNITRSQRL
jgi:D-alanyl-D-alanine dipeptidase